MSAAIGTSGPPDGIDGERASRLLHNLARIPDTSREFSTTQADAVRWLQLPAAVLGWLVARGLPVRPSSDGPRFDLFDLRNAALQLGVGASAQAARRFWAAGLNQPTGRGPLRYQVYYQAACPSPGHAAECHYRLAVPGGRRVERTFAAGARGPLLTTEVSLDTDWPALPGSQQDLLEAARGLEFMYLPTSIRTDLDFIRRTGLSDCAGTAELLVREGQRRGLAVRKSYGFIVAPPYSTRHHWAEVLVDARWVPVDPVLIAAMVAWRMLDPDAWPNHRSPGSIFARVADDWTPLLMHEGEEVPVTLLTQRLPATDRPRRVPCADDGTTNDAQKHVDA